MQVDLEDPASPALITSSGQARCPAWLAVGAGGGAPCGAGAVALCDQPTCCQLPAPTLPPSLPACSGPQVVSIIATDIPAGAAVVHLVADVLLPANLTAPVMMEGDAGALPAVDLAGEAGIMPEMEGDAADAPAAAN